DVKAHVVDRNDAKVRQPHRCGHRRTGEVQRLEARLLRLKRGQPIIRPRHLQDAGSLQERSEAYPRWPLGQVVGDKIGHRGSDQVFIANGSRLSPEKSIITFLMVVNSSRPSSPLSRPKPLSFMPPNGPCAASAR